MTDIDLTPMNEATARALFAEDAAQRAERFALQAEPREYSAEQTAELMAASRKLANQNWDLPDSVDPMTKAFYRERALAATLTTWKDVARQAWSQGYRMGDLDQYSGSYPRTKNPYEEI